MIKEINGLYVGNLHTDENMQSYWWNRLKNIKGVRTPKTYLFPLDNGTDFDSILETMEKEGWNKAFIRSDNFSDKINPDNGSTIHKREKSEIVRTFRVLKNHHINHMQALMGDYVILREWLDLDYCVKERCTEWHPTEVRFFVEDGEIQYVSPCLDSFIRLNLAHDCTYDYLRDKLKGLEELPYDEVRKVAKEFTEYAWHVDFCLTTEIKWYCIDMGVDGVYHDGNEWMTMCGHDQAIERQLKQKAEKQLSNEHIPT